MTKISLTLTIRPPFQQIGRKFRSANAKQAERRRETAREVGRELVQYVREEAPGSGTFAKKHFYRTYDVGSAVEMRLYAPQPLSRFIRFGTRPHSIAARQAGALAFFWPKIGMQVVVPKGGGFKTHVSGNVLWVGKGFVWHPGTKPNDYLARAQRKWRPGAVATLRKLASQFVIDLKGS